MSAPPDRALRRAPAAVGAAVLLVAVVAITADVLVGGWLRHVDWWVHQQIAAELGGAGPREVCWILSLSGQRKVVILPLLVSAALAARRHRTARPLALVVVLIVGLAVGILLFKHAVGRVPPRTGSDRLHAGGLSYPSGHAVNAIVCWRLSLEFAASLGGRMAHALPVSRRRLVTAILGAAAGLGMLGLDYHWLTDVLAGWALGVVILGAALRVGPVRSPARGRRGQVARQVVAPRAPSA